MMMKYSLWAVITALLFTACATTQNLDALPFKVIKINQSIPIAKGNARVFLENGEISKRGLNVYCELEVDTLSDGAHQIRPSTLRITGMYIWDSRDDVTDEPMMFEVFRCRDGVYRERHFTLISDEQTDIRKMVCRQYFSDCFGHYPTTTEIKQALGNYATLQ